LPVAAVSPATTAPRIVTGTWAATPVIAAPAVATRSTITVGARWSSVIFAARAASSGSGFLRRGLSRFGSGGGGDYDDLFRFGHQFGLLPVAVRARLFAASLRCGLSTGGTTTTAATSPRELAARTR